MTALATNISLNITQAEAVPPYDTIGAIVYIIGVLTWYAIGFGLILIDDINPQAGRAESHDHLSFYQTVNDLHEHEARNDILIELKDKDRRNKLWQYYYGTNKNHPTTIEKDRIAVGLIVKQLNELKERRRTLRDTLNEITIDQPDEEFINDESDDESFHSSPVMNTNKSVDHLKFNFK